MKTRKFLIVVAELFLILTLYKMWTNTTGFGLGSYLLVMLVLLYILNYFMNKYALGGDIGRNILYKVFGRMTFTKEWFGILTMFSVILGFAISSSLFKSAFMAYLVVILGVCLAIYLLGQVSNAARERGLYIIGFVVGIGIGSKYASSAFIITIFILGHIFLYFSSQPGEKESGLT